MRSIRELVQHVRTSRKGAERLLAAAAVGPGSDSLSRLPIELHIMLLEYLDQGEIILALNASKTLRLVWLSGDIWPWLADRWHPGLAETVRAEAVKRSLSIGLDKGSQGEVIEAGEILRRHLRHTSTRTTGKYASMLHHSLQLIGDPIFSLSKKVSTGHGGVHSTDDLSEEMLEVLKHPDHVSRFMVYNQGRIAWWPDAWTAPHIAVVDDLRTAQRRIYRFPSDFEIQKGYKTAMSDQLLVLGREKMLHAWHFEEDVLDSVAIPDLFERCIVEGSMVLIVTCSSELYKWEFGGSLERVSLGNLGCYQPGRIREGGLVEALLQAQNPTFHIPRRQGLLLKESGMFLDFIIHPSLGHVFFIVSMHEGQLLVHEIDHGMLARSYSLHDGMTSSTQRWKQVNEYLRWEKCDSYGGYRLLSVYLSDDDDLAPADLQRPEDPCCTCWRTTGLVSVCFNVYTKRFTVQCHHFLHFFAYLNPLPAAYHLWETKLYTSYAPTAMAAGMPLTALRCCLADQESLQDTGADSVPIYSTSENSRGMVARRHAAYPEKLQYLPTHAAPAQQWKKHIDFGFDVTSQFTWSSVASQATNLWKWNGHHMNHTITGDDDFLVYVVGGVYMAWSFADEIPMPKNEAARWAPWRRAQHKTE